MAQGLAASRAQAQALILSGKVRTGPDAVVQKPAQLVPDGVALIVEAPPRFVSRGGEKLEGFLEKFAVEVRGSRALDVGASTGGFTDCLLQRGAVEVTCVDVGRGQLHAKLRGDARVTNFEKVNARELETFALPHPDYDAVVMDLSFISLTKVLGPAWARVRAGGCLIALVKPQFEAGKTEVDKGRGVIRDAEVHARVCAEIRAFAAENLPGAVLLGETESPIHGADGNREFLMGWRRGA